MQNHYIPKFYLKRWAPNGKVVEFSRPNPKSREVKRHAKPPRGTGWEEGAYDFEGLPPEKRYHLETAFFQLLDTRAADALSVLENRTGVWTQALREAWVLFMMSLITRHPDDIKAFKAVYIRDFNKATDADRVAYEKVRQSYDPETASEFFANIGQRFLQNMAVNNVPKLILHERAIQSLLKMHWSVAAPPDHGYFLTSDRPTIRSFLGQENSHWLVPIGPKKLFVAAEKRDYAMRLHEAIYKQGWKEVNRQVVRQAVKLGFSDDERHLPFFQKHLAAATRPSMFWSFVSDPENAPPLVRVP